jgi:hypothetical protein
LRDLRSPWSGLPLRPFLTRRSRYFAVFAVFAGNYQRATSPSPQKSWSFGSRAEQGTARRPAVDPCKLAKGDLAGAEIACYRLRPP